MKPIRIIVLCVVLASFILTPCLLSSSYALEENEGGFSAPSAETEPEGSLPSDDTSEKTGPTVVERHILNQIKICFDPISYNYVPEIWELSNGFNFNSSQNQYFTYENPFDEDCVWSWGEVTEMIRQHNWGNHLLTEEELATIPYPLLFVNYHYIEEIYPDGTIHGISGWAEVLGYQGKAKDFEKWFSSYHRFSWPTILFPEGFKFEDS